MLVAFGEYGDLTVEQLVLKNPRHVSWVLWQIARERSQMAAVQPEIKRLIDIFNRKPINVKCHEEGCGKTAMLFTTDRRRFVEPFWWCDDCYSNQAGALPSKFIALKTYEQVLEYLNSPPRKVNSDYPKAIRALAEAKGLPKTLTKSAAVRFFEPF